MKLRVIPILLFTPLLAVTSAQAQARRQTAVLPSGGDAFGQQEQLLANDVIAKLVDGGGVEVVDRQRTQAILVEQNMQSTSRFSAESGSRLGKLLGIPSIVFVRIDEYTSTSRIKNVPIPFGIKTVTTGNVHLHGSAQVLDVATGAILAAPSADFDKDAVLSEVKTYGTIVKPSETDPQVQLRKLNDSAFDAVVQEIVPKIASAVPMGTAQAPLSALKVPKVAGVQAGQTVLNAGSTNGIKVGDTFQITREIDSGMIDPDTQQKILRKKKVCVLTIADVDESSSSGKCVGDVAQNSDKAVPIPAP